MNKEIINLNPRNSLVLFRQRAEGLPVKWAASAVPDCGVWSCSGKTSPALGFSGRIWPGSAVQIGVSWCLVPLTSSPG